MSGLSREEVLAIWESTVDRDAPETVLDFANEVWGRGFLDGEDAAYSQIFGEDYNA